MRESVVKPEILASVENEAEALATGAHRLEDPLKTSTGLMEFVEETFNQVFREELGVGISGFSQADKEEVLYLAGQASHRSQIEGLVRLYVDACNMWPDVLSQAYGGGSADFLEFRTELVPSLLRQLDDLATAREETDLRKTIMGAQEAYARAIATPHGATGSDS